LYHFDGRVLSVDRTDIIVAKNNYVALFIF